VDETFGQLVTLLLILAAWGIKGVSEARKRRGAPPRRAPPPGGAPAPGEEDRARSPERPRRDLPPVPYPRPSQRVAPAPLDVPASMAADLTRGYVADHQTEVRSVRRRRRRREALARLSPGAVRASARTLTRAGVLWSEGLGPPRAVRGPHQPPVLRRYR
jgi:hypothetical protein